MSLKDFNSPKSSRGRELFIYYLNNKFNYLFIYLALFSSHKIVQCGNHFCEFKNPKIHQKRNPVTVLFTVLYVQYLQF